MRTLSPNLGFITMKCQIATELFLVCVHRWIEAERARMNRSDEPRYYPDDIYTYMSQLESTKRCEAFRGGFRGIGYCSAVEISDNWNCEVLYAKQPIQLPIRFVFFSVCLDEKCGEPSCVDCKAARG
jgi:hypothetical protein